MSSPAALAPVTRYRQSRAAGTSSDFEEGLVMFMIQRSAAAVIVVLALGACSNMNNGTMARSPQLEMPYPTTPTAPVMGSQDKVEGSQAPAVQGPAK